MRLIVLALMLALAAPAAAASVRALNLEEMMRLADRVFVGKVVAVRVAFDAATQRPARFTTFEVIRPVKGNLGETVTIKQLAGQLPGQTVLPVGLPAFHPGQELVLFLHGDSSLGYTSPVGLAQGQMTVKTAPNGAKSVVGAFQQGPILKGLKNPWIKTAASANLRPAGKTGQAMDYGTFMSTLDNLAKPQAGPKAR